MQQKDDTSLVGGAQGDGDGEEEGTLNSNQFIESLLIIGTSLPANGFTIISVYAFFRL